MVIVARAGITGTATAGAIRAGGIIAIHHVVRCRRRVIIMATTDVRIMTTAVGRIAVTDTTGITAAGMAIIAINSVNDTNKNGTAQTVPFFMA
jgi:hypothetical protein